MSKIISILRVALYGAHKAKSAGELIWDYFKIEVTPPMTLSLVNGPLGQKLEATAEKLVDSVINGLNGQIKNIEHQAVLAAKAKEAAIQAQLAKEKEAAKKAEEQKKLAAEAAKKAAASKAAEAAKASEAKKATEAKKSSASKKDSAAKKPPAPPKKDKKPKK
ncbi:unnamed protein product [Arctia plantaginis]|uniref:Uncharacterized protein n=1 Tax=Arctia plantaginis TaxID=874455 RepID=A0A8S0ZXH9_ARCPL|nr:unnamed protein product [Arctia plantaginis]CAB3238674.1 unnamed protein product [Arctia plantaginis]